MIRLAVFDLAGTTLADGNAVSDCFRAAFAAEGISVPAAAVNAVMGMAKPVAIHKLLADWRAERLAPQVVEAIHADFVARMLRHYREDPNVREIEGTSAAFAALRAAGIKVAVNSGFSRVLVDAIIARLGWAAALDASIASDEVPQGRPHPDMIHALMKRLGIDDAKEVAKVGDTVVDLQEGHAAGCGQNIGVLTGSCTREQLAAHPHTKIVASVIEVTELMTG